MALALELAPKQKRPAGEPCCEPLVYPNLERRDGLWAYYYFNHAGIQVGSTDDVLRAKGRLVEAGLATFDEMDSTCCYARQDKIWVTAPDGESWEVFVTHGDAEDSVRSEDGATANATCCGTRERA